MIDFIITLGTIATMIATYVYLDWSIIQIFGVAFVLGMVYTADERGPIWRRSLWVALTFSLFVAGHFIIADNFIYWGALLLSCLLFMISISLVHYLFTAEPGAGSTLTFAFLGIIFIFPIAIYVLFLGMKGLGYW